MNKLIMSIIAVMLVALVVFASITVYSAGRKAHSIGENTYTIVSASNDSTSYTWMAGNLSSNKASPVLMEGTMAGNAGMMDDHGNNSSFHVALTAMEFPFINGHSNYSIFEVSLNVAGSVGPWIDPQAFVFNNSMLVEHNTSRTETALNANSSNGINVTGINRYYSGPDSSRSIHFQYNLSGWQERFHFGFTASEQFYVIGITSYTQLTLVITASLEELGSEAHCTFHLDILTGLA